MGRIVSAPTHTRTRDETHVSTCGARELTSGVARGERAALAALYEQWFDRMVMMAGRATGRDESFCMDAAQDAFIRLIRNPVVIESEGELGAYLRRLTVTSAYDRLKSERRRAKRESARGHANGSDGDGARERLAEVERAIAGLERAEAEMLLARYRFGWTLARIGEHVGLATGAVDGRIGRLVKRLRETIENEHDDVERDE